MFRFYLLLATLFILAFTMTAQAEEWTEKLPRIDLPNGKSITLGTFNDIQGLHLKDMRVSVELDVTNIVFELPSKVFPCAHENCLFELAIKKGKVIGIFIYNIESRSAGKTFLEQFYRKMGKATKDSYFESEALAFMGIKSFGSLTSYKGLTIPFCITFAIPQFDQ
jgi:hypothetical protein